MSNSNREYYQSALYQIHDGDSVPAPIVRPDADTMYRERPVPSVPPPAALKPREEELFVIDKYGERKPNAEFLKQHFLREGRLTEAQALFILVQATALLSSEANLVAVESPVVICGDIHGQYYDLMKLFEIGGNLYENSYLFLGDYVDRGSFGIECLLYLYALKLQFPTRITLLRGNHECRHLTEYFTFKRECLHKYSPAVYDACIQSFCALPVAALVDNRFFCVHGGISPELMTLQDLRNIDRFQEPGSSGLLCDLLWSDPVANFGHEQKPSSYGPPIPPGTMFEHNATRGCSYNYTYEAACKFLERNGLLGIIRGHEAKDAGYTMYRETPTKKFPSVITVFSAPNYLDAYHNRGAIIKYANKNITIRQYNSSSHPYWLPNFMDAFTWSLPFVGAKITEMLLAILSTCSPEELEESQVDEDEDDTRTLADLALTPGEIAQRRQEIKNKILAVGRMQRVFQVLREEAENSSELSALAAEEGDLGARLGPERLSVQGTNYIRNFDDARRSDLLNERLPTFQPEGMQNFPVIPAPSMRRRGSGDIDGMTMEELIRKALNEEDGKATVVERLAERIARGRKVAGRPSTLKRFETA
ncbi:hypothetical protein SERLA73DRAFT_114496 [Serpula lacrymans var. lacrymans S7.3]|uniref:Serine/threonine-protein phosphatase n=1 Tax=Serpula lacrymans var. lacrymans (strain S7.3) TaxID=936435 RepID=F8QAU7_SERL3|nr:hypothetical protein SERLA73DRAFT_114496 [Serpula lacrymans var. lacrymans S7.3]